MGCTGVGCSHTLHAAGQVVQEHLGLVLLTVESNNHQKPGVTTQTLSLFTVVSARWLEFGLFIGGGGHLKNNRGFISSQMCLCRFLGEPPMPALAILDILLLA